MKLQILLKTGLPATVPLAAAAGKIKTLTDYLEKNPQDVRMLLVYYSRAVVVFHKKPLSHLRTGVTNTTKELGTVLGLSHALSHVKRAIHSRSIPSENLCEQRAHRSVASAKHQL